MGALFENNSGEYPTNTTTQVLDSYENIVDQTENLADAILDNLTPEQLNNLDFEVFNGFTVRDVLEIRAISVLMRTGFEAWKLGQAAFASPEAGLCVLFGILVADVAEEAIEKLVQFYSKVDDTTFQQSGLSNVQQSFLTGFFASIGGEVLSELVQDAFQILREQALYQPPNLDNAGEPGTTHGILHVDGSEIGAAGILEGNAAREDPEAFSRAFVQFALGYAEQIYQAEGALVDLNSPLSEGLVVSRDGLIELDLRKVSAELEEEGRETLRAELLSIVESTGALVHLPSSEKDALLLRFGLTYKPDFLVHARHNSPVGVLEFEGSESTKDLIISGLAGDFLEGGLDDDVLLGGIGDDLLYGGEGADVLLGEVGLDFLDGGAGDDFLVGGENADRLIGGVGTNTLVGGADVDSVDYRSNSTGINLEIKDIDENDTGNIYVGQASDLGNTFIDKIYSVEFFYGSDQNTDQISFQSSPIGWEISRGFASKRGTPVGSPELSFLGFEKVIGSNFGDTIEGAETDDILEGREGDDLFIAYRGNDVFYGGVNQDTADFSNVGPGLVATVNEVPSGTAFEDAHLLTVSSHSTTVEVYGIERIIGSSQHVDTLDLSVVADSVTVLQQGESENVVLYEGGSFTLEHFENFVGLSIGDSIIGNDLGNLISGNGGSDQLDGGAGDDTLFGDEDSDSLFGGTGDDQLYGGIGPDQLNGDAGSDILYGDEGGDALYGGSGHDQIFGGLGSDFIAGGIGDDVLYGDDDNSPDTLQGGAGADIFYLGAGDVVQDLDAEDTAVYINGIQLTGGDRPDSGSPFEGNNGESVDVPTNAEGEPDGPATVTPAGGGAPVTIGDFQNGEAGAYFTPDDDDEEDDEHDDTRDDFTGARGLISPLALDLDGDGVELTPLAGSITYFDLDLDGFAEKTGWVAADDGLLAFDRDGNGRIDDISELFGNASTNGFSELAVLDSNSDGVIDASDQDFTRLLVW